MSNNKSDLVAQNAIICETIKKENKHHRLYTTYNINPLSNHLLLYNSICAHKSFYYLGNIGITAKPNILPDASYKEDDKYLNMLCRASLEPIKKYTRPQTEAQEIGWIPHLLENANNKKGDVRFHHVKKKTEITKYMEEYWKMREQRINLI
ncbi:hypothetical protein A3Q56_02187 [Intoshia linei]|uniref:Uncharacterized protein n=1 Tax=Intoshia linei TaxID=1819745 RepID=A0A177B7F3_9BILA|nr:hypothetical protein A3Q56_02187 [Intoshia linei]